MPNYLQLIILALAIIIWVIYLLQNKAIKFIASSINPLFILFSISLLVGLFYPKVFNKLADKTLIKTGVHQSVIELDDLLSFELLQESPKDLISDFLGEDNDEQQNEEMEADAGVIEENVYLRIVDLLGLIYRVFAIALSLVSLVFVLYISLLVNPANNVEDLQKRVKELEVKLNATLLVNQTHSTSTSSTPQDIQINQV